MKYFLLILCLWRIHASVQGVDYTPVASQIEPVIREEMRDWGIRGVSVALVDDQTVVYASAFGEAKRESLFRVGSISKLFNAIAIMQQVEAGKLRLDDPLPSEWIPINPFENVPAVTLRQILCHKSGLPRESPVGGYLDVTEPGLQATVNSAHACVLVTRPGEKTRYSNLGPSIAGFMVEQVSGQKYEDYQKTHLLNRLGMKHSAWTLAQVDRKRIVKSHMRIADGHGGWFWRETPLFDLGTIPAGNLFSCVDDLALFASALLAGGGPLVKSETLAEMWRPQLTDAETGFGLGFMVGKYRAHRTISHSGAVYGHSTSIVLLPDVKLAAIVLGNEDIANGRIRRMSEAALSILLECKLGEKPPPTVKKLTPTNVNDFTGDYESQSFWARLDMRNGLLVGNLSGQLTHFTFTGDITFLADSRIDDSSPGTFTRDAAGKIVGFTIGNQKYSRVIGTPAALPREWKAVLGRYGPEIIPLVISERYGHLYVMTENMVDYRLTPVNRRVCNLPPGMYVNEQLVFITNEKGRVLGIDFANMAFKRR